MIWDQGLHCLPLIQHFVDTLTGSIMELFKRKVIFALTLSTLGKISADDILKYFFLTGIGLTFHANCLHWRQFA